MFTKFHIQNFRTHVDTELIIKDLTLIIGSNNSGKSNLLAGLSFFSKLVSNAYPERKTRDKKVNKTDYFANKHSLSSQDKPITFLCQWKNEFANIQYFLEIYCIQETINCREKIDIDFKEQKFSFDHGFAKKSDELLLRTNIQDKISQKELQDTVSTFFRSLSSLHYYNFQPTLLKGQAFTMQYINGEAQPTPKRDFFKELKETNRRPNIVSDISKEGTNFQELIKYVKENESETYNRFLGFIKRFEQNSNFIGIHIDTQGQVKWQFDLGNSNFPFYSADKVSDGLIKAAAVALLCAMERPPSVIMIEEVENGINQKNLAEFLRWLVSTSGNGKKTQFILTTHSPSVIREFADNLDSVYSVHLKRKKGYVSELTNLNEAIKVLIRFGSISEETYAEENGIVRIKPYALTELFYNGILGEL